MRAATGPAKGSSNRRIRFAVPVLAEPLRDLLPPRVQAAGTRRRHPHRRGLLLYGAAHRLDVQLQPPGNFLLRHLLHQMQVANGLRHPDHLRVLLAESTRRPCRASSIITRGPLLPCAQGVPFHVATGSLFILPLPIIPIFGFPDWEWDQNSEVLIYPSRFDGEFSFGDSRGHNILGMVGTGGLNRLMILSKPDLISGFRNAGDKRNVGVHEFAHLVDKSDGVVDGTPRVGLDRQAIGPWVDLVRRKMAEIEAGHSDINRYALTNEAEFLRSCQSISLNDRASCSGSIRNSMHGSSECSTKTFVPGRRRFGVSSHRRGRPLAGTLLVHVEGGCPLRC